MGEHTPTPWSNNEHSNYVYSAEGNVCVCGEPRASRLVGYTPVEIGSDGLHEAVDNARFIVEAVNSYDRNRATIAALVGALEHIAKLEPVVDQATGYLDDSAQQTAIHALQLARGEKGDV